MREPIESDHNPKFEALFHDPSDADLSEASQKTFVEARKEQFADLIISFYNDGKQDGK